MENKNEMDPRVEKIIMECISLIAFCRSKIFFRQFSKLEKSQVYNMIKELKNAIESFEIEIYPDFP